VGSDRTGGRERCQSGAKAHKAHVLLATDVRWPEGVGVATQSDGKLIINSPNSDSTYTDISVYNILYYIGSRYALVAILGRSGLQWLVP